jgi:hypothetical protein
MSSCGITVVSLSLSFSTVGFLVFFGFKIFQVVLRGCFLPYNLLRGVTVVYVFTWRVSVVEWCCVSACLDTGDFRGEGV